MADTIREYLVSLGFSVDEAKLHRFQDAISGTLSSTTKLGVEVVGVGYALTEMVERVARHFEDLYYMSQRTGATVSGLDAIGFAARQVGLSAEQAHGAVEGFADAMRMNPGLRGLAGGLLGKRGGDIDPEKDLMPLVKRLSAMPDFIAVRWAAMFNIPAQVYLHLKNNMRELAEAEVEHRRRMREAGVDVDKDKGRWVEFTRTLNNATDAFTVMGTRIADDWRPQIQGLAKEVGSLAESFNRANASSEGVLGKVTSLVAAFGGVSAILALLGRLFGFKTGIGLRTLGAVGLPVMAMEMMSDKGAETSTNLRTGLRSLFGIEDPHEPLPWMPGGTWGIGKHESPNPWFPLDISNRDRPPTAPSSDRDINSPFVNPARIGGQAQNLTGPIIGGASSSAVTVHQTNSFSGHFDPDDVARRIGGANRELVDALRNLYQKAR